MVSFNGVKCYVEATHFNHPMYARPKMRPGERALALHLQDWDSIGERGMDLSLTYPEGCEERLGEMPPKRVLNAITKQLDALLDWHNVGVPQEFELRGVPVSFTLSETPAYSPTYVGWGNPGDGRWPEGDWAHKIYQTVRKKYRKYRADIDLPMVLAIAVPPHLLGTGGGFDHPEIIYGPVRMVADSDGCSNILGQITDVHCGNWFNHHTMKPMAMLLAGIWIFPLLTPERASPIFCVAPHLRSPRQTLPAPFFSGRYTRIMAFTGGPLIVLECVDALAGGGKGDAVVKNEKYLISRRDLLERGWSRKLIKKVNLHAESDQPKGERVYDFANVLIMEDIPAIKAELERVKEWRLVTGAAGTPGHEHNHKQVTDWSIVRSWPVTPGEIGPRYDGLTNSDMFRRGWSRRLLAKYLVPDAYSENNKAVTTYSLALVTHVEETNEEVKRALDRYWNKVAELDRPSVYQTVMERRPARGTRL